MLAKRKIKQLKQRADKTTTTTSRANQYSPNSVKLTMNTWRQYTLIYLLLASFSLVAGLTLANIHS